MNKKYEFTDETITIDGNILHRIKSVRSFRFASEGELGGFIEKEENLSHDGGAWVSGEARVYGGASVFGEALVSDKAQVYDNAVVYGGAIIYGNSVVCGNSVIYGNAAVRDNAVVCGNVKVCDNATVRDNARVCADAIVCDNAGVFDNAHVYGHAYVSNNVMIRCGVSCITNINSDLEESIRVQTGLIPVNGEVIAYKQVQKDLTSFYDPDFKYEIGKIAKAKDPDESDESCAPGLHFSNANYWNDRKDVAKSTFLIARIKLEDIITVQEGKIRCRKAEIIGKYDIKL